VRDDLPAREKNLSQTVLKALAVMEHLASEPRAFSAQEVASACDLSRPTAYRLLSTLASGGYVAVEAHGQYRLGTKLIVLGKHILNNLDWPSQARPILYALAEQTHETVPLGLLDGNEVLYVDKVESPQSVRMVSTIGMRNPLYCTAMGKAMLAQMAPARRRLLLDGHPLAARTPHTISDPAALEAHLEQVRAEGTAIDDEENEVGIRCIAAPIVTRRGVIVGAVSISGPAYRLPVERLQGFAATLADAVRRISERA
jgi:DNA-binding IclR family transcriptional regulator